MITPRGMGEAADACSRVGADRQEAPAAAADTRSGRAEGGEGVGQMNRRTGLGRCLLQVKHLEAND